jgi:GT2 family glycosyltransferase
MISIVIPVHNRKKYTEKCLRSLRNQTYQADNIIVVDDGSKDGTREMLEQEFPEIIALSGGENLFWTAAINKGIKLALALGADYVMTLNNDTVASPGFIEKMMLHMDHNTPALLGAFDVDMATQKPYYGGEIFDWRSSTSKYLLNVLKKEEQNGLHEVSLLPARGLLIPRAVFDAIGLFAEKQLPHYLADYDFTQRARKRGFKIYCNYDAILYTYPEEGGDYKIRARKTLRNYFKHLFNIKGGGNMKNFTIYALRNCPRRDILIALLTGYSRRLGGFWLGK